MFNSGEDISCHGVKILDVLRLTQEELEGVLSDLREVVQFWHQRWSEELMEKLIKGNRRFSKMSMEAAYVLKELAKLEEDIEIDMGKWMFDMCDAWKERRKRAMKEGLWFGERTIMNRVILNLRKLRMSIPEISSIVEKTENEVLHILTSRRTGKCLLS